MKTQVGMLLGAVVMLLCCAATSAQDRPTINAIVESPTIDTYRALRSVFHGD